MYQDMPWLSAMFDGSDLIFLLEIFWIWLNIKMCVLFHFPSTFWSFLLDLLNSSFYKPCLLLSWCHITSLLNPEHFFWLGNFFFQSRRKVASGEFMVLNTFKILFWTEEWPPVFLTSCVVTVFHVRHILA